MLRLLEGLTVEAETRAGRLHCPDAAEAADIFSGMVIGHRQLAALIGIPQDLDEAKIEEQQPLSWSQTRWS